MTVDSDWDFLVALATTAVVIAGVVLVYMLVTYRRARAAERASLADAEAGAEAASAGREPMFFRRYLPDADEPAPERESGRE